MKRGRSIVRPLMLSLIGALVVVWLGAIGLSIVVMREEFDEIFDSALKEASERLLVIVSEEMHPDVLSAAESGRVFSSTGRRQYIVYQVRHANGHLIYRSKDAPEQPFDVPLKVGFRDTGKYRVFTAATSDEKLFLQAADDFGHRREAVMESAATMLWPLVMLIPVSLLVVWLIARRAVTPINALRTSISERDDGNLSPVEAETLPNELRPIASSVNLLLQRLRSALDAEREFTANSAHELRTPIAGALAQTQRLLAELPDGSLKARTRNIEAALTKLGRISEKLLQLARADAGLGAKETKTDLLKVLDLIVFDFQRSVETSNQIDYIVAPSASLIRNVDIDAFGIVMRNLIENATIHGEPDGPIKVWVDEDSAIRVISNGPAVAEADLAAFKQRFHRGDAKRKGAGLGLPIADKIVRQMGGTLQLHSPVPGNDQGFEARIILPG